MSISMAKYAGWKNTLKNYGLAALGGSVGFAVPDAIAEGFNPENKKSFATRLYEGTKDMLPYGLVFGGLGGLKAFRQKGLNNSKYFKNLKLTKGKDALIKVRKDWKKWPAIGAAAGAYVNYDKDKPLSSIAKGAAGGALLFSPKAFKSQMNHGGMAHTAVDSAIDGVGFLALPAAITSGATKYYKYKQEADLAKRRKLLERKIFARYSKPGNNTGRF